jgi:small subunit ribosomal protein S6
VKIGENPWQEMEMNRTYELMFIVRPDMADEDLDKLISNLEHTVTSASGTVKNVERMGKRRLAYTVRKFREGVYILMVIEGAGSVMHEVERRLRVTEQVIKFLTVRIDEEQKRLDKIKALRAAKQKRSAQPVPAAEEPAATGETPAAEATATA